MKLHHLGEIDTTATTAVLTGDPDRVPALASHLGNGCRQWAQRGYVCVETTLDGTPVLVCSTGIGGPSTAIAVEELVQLGITQLIRIGTCGSMQRQIKAGHVVISTGCVRDEGTSHQYLPAEYPVTPDFALLRAVVTAVEADGIGHFIGTTHCKDAYYAEKPDGFPLADHWRQRWAGLRASGVLATEMEAATLFALAAIRRVRAAGLFVATDDTLSAAQTLDIIKATTRAAACGALSLTRELKTSSTNTLGLIGSPDRS